jgi:hypothetical protein
MSACLTMNAPEFKIRVSVMEWPTSTEMLAVGPIFNPPLFLKYVVKRYL